MRTFDYEAFQRIQEADYERHRPRLVDVPEGVSGDWKVERFTVETSISTLRHAFDGRAIPPGIYTRLSSPKADAWMTDTPAEYRDAAYFIHAASGDVLISGLGLGMVVKALLAKDEITSITVVEIESDVIALVADSYPDPRLRVINADAYTWKPDQSFDWAWHDIWGDVSTDDLPDMARMCRHYARSMRARDRQLVWGRDLVRR